MVYGSRYETQARNGVRAVAQSGVSNQRDAYGNLIRNTGGYSVRGVNQGPVNIGPIKNSSAQPPTANVGTAKGTVR
jgi:hypothetical protein